VTIFSSISSSSLNQGSNPLALSKTSYWDLSVAINLTSEELVSDNVPEV
jgi:hypothetical protein